MKTLYLLEFPDGKKYIGSTNNFRVRMHTHKQRMKTKYNNKVMYDAMQNIGWNNISKTIIEEIPKEQSDSWERELIKFFNTTNAEFGFNIQFGGNSRPIKCYSKSNGQFIRRYNSIKDAEIKLNLNTPNIIEVLKHRRKSTGGYKFEYA